MRAILFAYQALTERCGNAKSLLDENDISHDRIPREKHLTRKAYMNSHRIVASNIRIVETNSS